MAADESAGQGALYRLDPDLRLTCAPAVGSLQRHRLEPGRPVSYVDSLAYQIEAMDTTRPPGRPAAAGCWPHSATAG